MDTNTGDLVKVHIDLPNHWAIGGEAFWAQPLGEDLYEIHNVPFFAYGLNFLDVVYATPDADDLIPEIKKVSRPSGHRTYRVIFESGIDRLQQAELLEILEQWGGTYERADGTNISIDIKPDGDYVAIYDQLDKFANSGYLSFETCEARADGSFDDLPEDDRE